MNAPIEKVNTQPLMHGKRRMPKYKRNFLARLLRKWLKYIRDLMEEDTSFNIAAHWSRGTVKCKGCRAVLASDTMYCSTCGRAQATVATPTAPSSATLLRNYHASRSFEIDTTTGRITMGSLPGESVKETIGRLRRLGVFNKEGKFR